MKTVVVLDGMWDFVADLDPKYHAARRGFEKPEANRRHWQKVPVPGAWQTYGERYAIFEGVCWFAREFMVGDEAGSARARLCFGAVNYLAKVYLNGVLVGSHEGGYTEFSFDVTGRLKSGRNHLAVQVDNRATTIKWPPCLGYFNYGGIHRGVRLELAGGPVLSEVTLQAATIADGWELVVGGRVLDPPADSIVCVRNGDGISWEERLQPDGVVAVRVPFFEVPPWTPENPHLEPVSVELLDGSRRVIDQYDCEFGFRTVAMRDGHVQLNGGSYPLKGVCYVCDSEANGLVLTPPQIEIDLRLMKDAGCNAVRCHYPMDSGFYDACDRLGLLVWIEPPVYCYHPADGELGTRFADPDWLALAEQMVREMIVTSRNHPSVVIYGIGNECNTANPEAAAFFTQLATTIRAEDPTRLLSYAALYGIVGPLADLVDVLGINSYWGWYDRIWSAQRPAESADGSALPTVERVPIDLTPMREMLNAVLDGNADVALFLTEFGADSVPGNHSASRDLWSEEYHADLLREILGLAQDHPRIVGTFPFCFCDYRDPSKIPNGYWDEQNLKGLVDYRRHPKLAFHAVQQVYRGPLS